MTPAESAQLRDLMFRLFGADGQGGALGRIEGKIDRQDDRLATLENDRIARQAVEAERQRERTEERRRFYNRNSVLLGLAAACGAVVGPLIASALGMLR